MKFLVLLSDAEGGHPARPEHVDELSGGSRQWLDEQLRSRRVEAAYVFPEGGGCMIVNAHSPEELHDTLQSNPSSAFLRHDVKILLDFHGTMERYAGHYRASLAHPQDAEARR